MPLRDTPDGIVLRVRVTPRSARDAVDGIEPTAEGDAVKVRVRALPADGAANEAIERVIAQWLGVAKRDVSLRSGARSRVKSVAVAGNSAELTATVRALLTAAAQR